jgi:integrase
MAKGAITKRTVDAAKPGAKDQFIWDNEVAGFGLKVTPTGSKIYVLQYRIARAGEADRTPAKRYTIGKHGKLTPEQARKRAKELAALVEEGIDPRQRELELIKAKDEADRLAQERARLEGELAFENIARLWLAHYENELDHRPSSVRLAKLVVKNHLMPKLKGKPMPHIGRAELQSIIDAIPLQQRGMRRAVFAYASVLFGWSVKRGQIASNPLTGMAKPEAPKARKRFLIDDELAVAWKASKALGDPFGPFFRLLILTGQRREEVAAMTWSELDRSTSSWTIPADRAKNGVSNIVPLSALALKELDSISDGENWPKAGFVLTTTGRTPISGISKAKARLDAGMAAARENSLPAPWRIHDLRRTMATGFQRLGIRFEVTEATLNHVSGAKGGVAGIYQQHDWKDEKRCALEAWAKHIEAIIEPVDASNVVSLDAAKRRG